MAVKLVILSDVRLYREGLSLALAGRPDEVKVVGSCGNVDQLVEDAGEYAGSVVLVDLAGLDRMGDIRRVSGAVRDVTLLGLAISPQSEGEIVAAAEAGITGCVPPDASMDDLLTTVARTARGELICTPRVAGTLVRRLAALAAVNTPPETTESLTTREREVLELLDAGLSNKQIARHLSIRIATVKNHVHSILAKLNVKRRGEAVAAVRGESRLPARADPRNSIAGALFP